MKLRNKSKRFISVMIIVIIILTGLVSRFWIQLLLIQGESMEPTFHHLELAIVEKYDRDFQVGDVVLIKCSALGSNIVKRIVACPGDRIVIRDGILLINNCESVMQFMGVRIEYAGIAEEEIVLGKEQYFVLGDNIQYSKDSRYPEIGIISKDTIVGKIIK